MIECNEWVNFGDVSPDHGQTWIKPGGDDYAEIVSVLSGSDIGIADNQYMIERGTIYFGPDHWDSAMSCCDTGIYGPPTYFDVAYAFYVYWGFDRDTWNGFSVVQVGKELDDWTASGTTHEESDVILHGNASIERYLEREYLQ